MLVWKTVVGKLKSYVTIDTFIQGKISQHVTLLFFSPLNSLMLVDSKVNCVILLYHNFLIEYHNFLIEYIIMIKYSPCFNCTFM